MPVIILDKYRAAIREIRADIESFVLFSNRWANLRLFFNKLIGNVTFLDTMNIGLDPQLNKATIAAYKLNTNRITLKFVSTQNVYLPNLNTNYIDINNLNLDALEIN